MKTVFGKAVLRPPLFLAAAFAAGWIIASVSAPARTRNIPLSALAAAYPETPGQLAPYLELTENALSRSETAEDKALADELRRRFAESYFDLKTVPGMERLQDNALAAARGGDPKQLGNALLMLVLTRDALASATAQSAALTPERGAFLQNVALDLGLTTEDELRQLRAFLDWSGRRDWMPEVRDALLRFERHIADAAPLAEWLPQWVNSIPALPQAETGSGVLPASWTWRGHAAAKELAEAVDAEWAATVLREYRTNALSAWKGAAATIWDGMPNSIPDADIPALLAEAAEGNDPASRFAALAHEHLSPMFGTADAPPEILWLRHRNQSGGADARALTASLNAAAGARVWPTLSPLAADICVRHLRSRQSALELDAAWLRTVYTPSRFGPEEPSRGAELLREFLTGPADGFWEWTGPGDDMIGGARPHGVPFAFSREFLDYCNAALVHARSPALAEIPLTLSVDSVTVSGEKVVERPTAAAFRLGSRRAGKAIVHKNYPVTGDWLWTPEIAEAEISIAFPSHTATLSFVTPEELRDFYTLFGEGSRILAPDDFGPGSARVLRNLGIREITINAALSNLEKLLPQLSRPALPPLPKSIIPRREERKAARSENFR